MAIPKEVFEGYVKNFDFKNLFIDMGWNRDSFEYRIEFDGVEYYFKSAAEKRNFKIIVCSGASIPDYSTRRKLEVKLTPLIKEHLIIFTDYQKKEQIWQYISRRPGKPAKVTETRYNTTQAPELLYQRASGLFFELDDEDKITIIDVTIAVDDNFSRNAEKVTKKFYERFKKEHDGFLGFIKGIEEKTDKEWYASLMLNRLMFCYFIQKKGFLDNNKNYLPDKLSLCKKKKGEDKFYSFYRNFLLLLFHKGLGKPNHNKALKDEIGRIPYLNGGLFDVHELELKNENIEISDTAFKRVFDFFEEYEWHLDTRADSTGKEINPDVIGYIFEKYINDRAQMGAYYTKEDITEYISKNTIIPYLFDEVKRKYPYDFGSEDIGGVTLKESGDKYIYDAVKFGVNPADLWRDLPAEIKTGLDPNQKDLYIIRKPWNRPAPESIALPTEIYREVIERRKRYKEIKDKIAAGEIKEINDFITYNLNITQFAQDFIENTEDPKLIEHFYKALTGITILDPTCGSGAFLFAALNILEPLYEAAIMRMRAFVEDEDRKNTGDKKTFSNKFPEFRKVLGDIQSPAHPNQQYFIYKSIILKNLHGVDIMNEAVEIAKLRLFLKLVATVDADYSKPYLGLEPLPDIDFNIRAGNTLVGLATVSEAEEIFTSGLDFDNAFGKIKEKCDVVATAHRHYKEIQLTAGENSEQFAKEKKEANRRLKELNKELNKQYHAKYYGNVKYDEWLRTHKPFHWFAEFYEIIYDHGGFDVVIGNPPYVEYSNTTLGLYKIINYNTIECRNLYGYVIERSFAISSLKSNISMITPLSLVSTNSFQNVQKYFLKHLTYFSNYAATSDPGILFIGVKLQLTIFLTLKTYKPKTYTTNYRKWFIEERDFVFSNFTYASASNFIIKGSIPKFGKNEEKNIIEKIRKQIKNISITKLHTPYQIYYKKYGNYFFKIFLDFIPYFSINNDISQSGSINNIFLTSETEKYVYLSIFNSNLFYYNYMLYSDCRNINNREFENFYCDYSLFEEITKKRLVELSNNLMKDIKNYSRIRVENLKNGDERRVQIFDKFKLSKHFIDQIDKVLKEQYGLTEEELDFIINYDIKYRMGKETENDD